jgi:hypothetical protein
MAYTQQFASAKWKKKLRSWKKNTPRNKHTHLDTQRNCNRSPNNNNQNTHTETEEELQQKS